MSDIPGGSHVRLLVKGLPMGGVDTAYAASIVNGVVPVLDFRQFFQCLEL
jgi:hypothetical protein